MIPYNGETRVRHLWVTSRSWGQKSIYDRFLAFLTYQCMTWEVNILFLLYRCISSKSLMLNIRIGTYLKGWLLLIWNGITPMVWKSTAYIELLLCSNIFFSWNRCFHDFYLLHLLSRLVLVETEHEMDKVRTCLLSFIFSTNLAYSVLNGELPIYLCSTWTKKIKTRLKLRNIK